jgi:uncharacterized protein YjcR
MPGSVIRTAAISVEEVREAHRAYVAGERRVPEIALGLGVCAETMKRRFRRLGLEIRRPGPKPLLLDDEVVRGAHGAYITGERRSGEVALGLGVNDETMRKHFRRLGLEIRRARGIPLPLNEEAVRQAHRTYVAGEHHVAEVAIGLGVSPGIMRKHFRRLGLEVRPPGGMPRPLRDEAVRRAHRVYVARERRVAEIASGLGVSPHTMRAHFRRLGLEIRQRSGIRCLPNDEEVRAAHRSYIAGERPVAEIAHGLGISDETMRRRFRGLGLDIRQPGRTPLLSTDDEVRQAHRAYIKGERRVDEIAIGLGVSAETMRRRFRRLRLEIRQLPLDDEAVRQANRAYITGESRVAEIAFGLAVNEETLRRRFRRLGLESRQRGGTPLHLDDKAVRQAHRAYIAGERTVAEIALGLGVSADTMRRRFRRHGLDIRQARGSLAP